MSKQQRYTEEFKPAAVKQVTERHYPVAEVAERLGIFQPQSLCLDQTLQPTRSAATA